MSRELPKTQWPIDAARIDFTNTITIHGMSARRFTMAEGAQILIHDNGQAEIRKDGAIAIVSPHMWTHAEPRGYEAQFRDSSNAAAYAEVATPEHFDNNRDKVVAQPMDTRRGPGRPRKHS